MRRKTLIVSNPGEQGADNYCEGVNQDVKNYVSFLTEPFGGYWDNSEIRLLPRPSRNELTKAIAELGTYDYSIVVFTGHGYYNAHLQSTMLELRKQEEIDSAELRKGALKRTIILDCCRKVEKIPTLEEALLKAEVRKSLRLLDSSLCRHYYNTYIEQCPQALITTYACAIGELAGDDSQNGGFYSSSLLRVGTVWAQNQMGNQHAFLSIPSGHEDAAVVVKRWSEGKQNPRIEKPRSGEYFPLAVVA